MKVTKNKLIAAAVIIAVLIVAYFSSGPLDRPSKRSPSSTPEAAVSTDAGQQSASANGSNSAKDGNAGANAGSNAGAIEGSNASADADIGPTSDAADRQSAGQDSGAANALPLGDGSTPDGKAPSTASQGATEPNQTSGAANSPSEAKNGNGGGQAAQSDKATGKPQGKPAETSPAGASSTTVADKSTKPATKPSTKPAASTKPAMTLDPRTGKDNYQTDPVPAGKPLPVEPQDTTVSDKAMTAYLSVSCATILDNMDKLDPEKVELVPKDGVIFAKRAVTFYEGESVFNVLQREMKRNKIHMEFENTPIYNSAYIEGINNLYEFDVGELSGWMYKVNGWFPNYGASRYKLKQGDVVEWVYTCDLGRDVGDTYSATGGGKK